MDEIIGDDRGTKQWAYFAILIGVLLMMGSIFFYVSYSTNLSLPNDTIFLTIIILGTGITAIIIGVYNFIEMRFILNDAGINIIDKYGRTRMIMWSEIKEIQLIQHTLFNSILNNIYGSHRGTSLIFKFKSGNIYTLMVDVDMDSNTFEYLFTSITKFCELKNIPIKIDTPIP